MLRLTHLMLLLLSAWALEAQDLSIRSLPLTLVKDANVIKRNEVLEISIKSPARAVVKHTYAYTILNDKADGYAEFSAYYSKFVTISDIEGKLIDASGKELKKVRKKDISDLSSESGMSVSDARLKTHSFYHKDYPYTVEYTMVLEIDGMFSLPGWVPQNSPTMGVQKSSVIIHTPPGYTFRHKAYNYSGQPKITEEAGAKTFEWTAENMKPLRLEPVMPGWTRVRPHIAFAPDQFEIEGYKGTMNNWKEFGSFIYQLTKNRDALPPEIASKAKQMTAGVKDPYKKIEILYKYLQDNTRYISIQLGIGGWQPIPAAKVAQNGYGDCKALTNYMAAMLREVGMESKYALIKSGDAGLYIDPDFVSNQFDHVILSVPLQKDTVWLECTSNILPAGYLGDFTYNRPSLLIDEKGGTLVYTPSYAKNENIQQRNIEAIIDESGNLKARAQTRYTGLQQDELHGFIKMTGREKILKMLRDRFDLPTYDIVDFLYDENPGRIPELKETIDLTVVGFAQVSGKRLFLIPNILSKSGAKLTADSVRKFDVEIDYDYIDTDTVQIKLPVGYDVESLPKPVNVQTKFGSYASNFAFEQDIVIYTRSIQKNKGRFPPEDFKAYADFMQTVHKSDRVKVVMKKRE